MRPLKNKKKDVLTLTEAENDYLTPEGIHVGAIFLICSYPQSHIKLCLKCLFFYFRNYTICYNNFYYIDAIAGGAGKKRVNVLEEQFIKSL